jgi:hypothetical protein
MLIEIQIRDIGIEGKPGLVFASKAHSKMNNTQTKIPSVFLLNLFTPSHHIR